MVRAILLVAVAVTVLAVPGGAGAKPAPAGPIERTVSVLQSTRVDYEKDLTTTPLSEVLADLGQRYQVTFVINKAAFADAADQVPDAKATRLTATKLEGLRFGTYLDIYLRGLSVPDVTFLARPDYIEITTREMAHKEAGLLEAVEKAKTTGDPEELVGAKARLNLPLVCVATRDEPLGAVLTELSRVYGLNIVIDPSVREAVKVSPAVQLLNVPADTALELLTEQAGLRIVRRGNTFRVVPSGDAQ
jgi:type II secretory pathway component GspD/PulD (secretin)